jgi:hypothetical protein
VRNKYTIIDGVRHIEVITKGEKHTVKIDESDVEKLQGKSVYKIAKRYYAVKINGKGHLIHRLITDCPEHLVVDHINGDTTDNTRANLKVGTVGDNNRNPNNKYVSSKSGVRNVHWYSRTKQWRVAISVNNQNKCFGYYDTIEEAEKVARKVRGELHDTV